MLGHVYGSQDATPEEVLRLLKVEAMLRVEKGYWVKMVETAVPQSTHTINLGKQLFASGELWQFGLQKPPVADMLAWLQSMLYM